jgi:hypothetical protein
MAQYNSTLLVKSTVGAVALALRPSLNSCINTLPRIMSSVSWKNKNLHWKKNTRYWIQTQYREVVRYCIRRNAYLLSCSDLTFLQIKTWVRKSRQKSTCSYSKCCGSESFYCGFGSDFSMSSNPDPIFNRFWILFRIRSFSSRKMILKVLKGHFNTYDCEYRYILFKAKNI